MMQTNLNGGRSFLRSLRNVQFPTCGRMIACWALVIGMALAGGPAAAAQGDASGKVAVSGELRQWHKVTPGSFTVQWFNPRHGRALQQGSVTRVQGGGKAALGTPPKDVTDDWLIVLKR